MPFRFGRARGSVGRGGCVEGEGAATTRGGLVVQRKATTVGEIFFFVVGNVREIFCHSCRLLGKNLSLCPGPAHWPYTAWNKRKTFSSVHGPASSHYVPLQAGPVQQLPTRQA
jgi:hypothetical protein